MLRAAPFFGSGFLWARSPEGPPDTSDLGFAETRYKPHYPTPSNLADVLRFVVPGSDDYVTERYAVEIEARLSRWGEALKRSPRDRSQLEALLALEFAASPFAPAHEVNLRSGFGIDVTQRHFAAPAGCSHAAFLKQVEAWLGPIKSIETAEFEIYEINAVSNDPLTVHAAVRYDFVATRDDGHREERVGAWKMRWLQNGGAWTVSRWEAMPETLSLGTSEGFVDVTSEAFGGTASFAAQLMHGVDYWRTVLDGACGTDIYANNGVATGDFDNDGFDDIYVCQPAGLPNRLYRNRGDGTFEDATEKAGVGVLDNTACALFADFDNRGVQDLLVVCGSGPLLFQNQGDGTFKLKRDAFQFAQAPQGTFTHAAIADYDGDGRLDVYLCTYQYYLGLDQYHYPAPYYDARNGPPNVLLHNAGGGRFVETTKAAGMNVENNRYSFACAWGDSNGNGHPDLVVANDFGTSQLYRNNGDGTFTYAAKESHVEDVGAGMSACWSDFDNDGHQDIYISSMWEAAGQRVSEQPQFHADAPEGVKEKYRRHARGNALYRNNGDGTFKNLGEQTGTAMGRWSWSADFWDVDHDGYPDLYVTNGYISATEKDDLASFFWRQVVAKSPDDATPRRAYEHGWSAINELIRSDSSWNAHERNVMFANNRDGTFAEVSGVVGLDCLEDSRSFALADIDHDGRLEVVLKNRDAPQLRILHNNMKEIGGSIAFRLRGHKSNRDAIGAAVTLEAGGIRQTRYLQAGSGFLAQHSKEMFFGVGKAEGPLTATVRWPSGLVQQFRALPLGHRIEIEEGVGAVVAKAFAATPANYARPAAMTEIAGLPTQVGTWLVARLKAPEFSLPDMSGSVHELKQLSDSFVLLHLWAVDAPGCREQLRELQRKQSAFAAETLEVLAINMDDAAHVAEARALVTREGIRLPVLFATDEVAGIYNIVFRYLFDRRRDLGLPTSFLLDKEGMIAKVYQGAVDPEAVLRDLRIVPTTAEERVRLALPFKGQLVDGAFQRNDFTYGVAFFQHGYLEPAAESFQQVVAARPNDPEAFYNLGTLELRRNNFEKARGYLERTVQLRPDYPEAWNNLGMMYGQEGQPGPAIENFRKAIELRPEYQIALLNLGNIYRRQGEFAKAEEALRHALAIQPDDAEANYSLGMMYAQQKQLDVASGYLEKAIELRPAYPEALNNLGIIFVRQQNPAKAEEYFKTAIRVVPSNDQAYLNLARLYVIENDRAGARRVLGELLSIQPKNAAAASALEGLQ
jgi:Flp pilus assembly protein TadD/peroxiredoxin